MNKYKLIFHHLGIAIDKYAKALKFMEGLGYTFGNSIYDPLQKVNLIYCHHDTMPDAELIYKADENGPLNDLLKYSKENIYHQCYESNNLYETLELIKNDGFRIVTISQPKPAVLFNGRNVSFYYIPGFGVIEILEKAS